MCVYDFMIFRNLYNGDSKRFIYFWRKRTYGDFLSYYEEKKMLKPDLESTSYSYNNTFYKKKYFISFFFQKKKSKVETKFLERNQNLQWLKLKSFFVYKSKLITSRHSQHRGRLFFPFVKKIIK